MLCFEKPFSNEFQLNLLSWWVRLQDIKYLSRLQWIREVQLLPVWPALDLLIESGPLALFQMAAFSPSLSYTPLTTHRSQRGDSSYIFPYLYLCFEDRFSLKEFQVLSASVVLQGAPWGLHPALKMEAHYSQNPTNIKYLSVCCISRHSTSLPSCLFSPCPLSGHTHTVPYLPGGSFWVTSYSHVIYH